MDLRLGTSGTVHIQTVKSVTLHHIFPASVSHGLNLCLPGDRCKALLCSHNRNRQSQCHGNGSGQTSGYDITFNMIFRCLSIFLMQNSFYGFFSHPIHSKQSIYCFIQDSKIFIFFPAKTRISVSVFSSFLLSCSRSFPAVLPQYLKYSFPCQTTQQETDSCNLSLQISRPAEV